MSTMADAREDASDQLLALPPELRTLVTFLDVDHRPTVILTFVTDVSSALSGIPADVVYVNAALHGLSAPEQELEDLRQALRKSASLNGTTDWHGKILDGQRWQTTECGNYVVAVAMPQQTTATFPIMKSPEKGNNPLNGHKRSDSQNHTARKAWDWTRHDLAGLSPYVQFIRKFNWASTALGPMDSWSLLLRRNMLALMANPNPRLIVWGEDMVFCYNEACVKLFGEKHPDALGKHTSFIWAEVWDDVKPLLDSTFNGETIQMAGLHLAIERNGFVEETYWDCTLSPIFDDCGVPIGIFDELTEVTSTVTGDRRRSGVTKLSERMASATTLPELWTGILTSFEESPVDAPFALLYAVVDDVADSAEAESLMTESSSSNHSKCARLVGTVGLLENHPAAIDTFALMEHIEKSVGISEPCLKAWKTRESVFLTASDDTLPKNLQEVLPGRGFDVQIKNALVAPIKSTTGNDILGILVTGLNPRCQFQGEYAMFIHVILDFVEKAAALITLPGEQKKIADVNHALVNQLRLTTLKAERSEAKFSRLAASAPTGMFMLDVDGRPLYVNDTYLEMLGHTDKTEYLRAPVSSDWAAQVHDDDQEKFHQNWQLIREQKVPITVEYRLKRPWKSPDSSEEEGETWLLATAFPEIEADGSVTAIQGWLTDISHRKFAENMLNQRLEDALENKRQTENFIDMTSHEMRNPLSAILQSADSIVSTLTATGLPSAQQDMKLSAATADDVIDAAQTIILCAQHQKRIVDDILTLSKLDASLLVMSPDKVRVEPLIAKALKMYESEIERAGIDAHLCLEPSYEELGVDWVFLDPSRLLQIIINLLTNSIKFTQHSDVRKIKICLGASHQRPTGKHHRISFVPARPNRPARSPLPSDSSNSSSNNEIYLQFAVIDSGKGLDDEEMKMLFQRFQQASPKTYSQYGGSGLGLFISRELCELQGGQIGVASQEGHTAFAFFIKAKRWSPEIEMEEKNAKPSLNRFSSAAASPIAFSRRGSSVLQELTNQMSSHTEADGATIHEFEPLPHRRSRTPVPTNVLTEEPEAQAESEKKQLHVLLVEDNLINQKVMSQQLRRSGCVVHVANHGLECLDFLEKTSFCSQQTPLHLILLDLEMPTMDGLTCIKHIRERQQDGRVNSHVPVIAVTANARSEQIAIAIEAGMDQVVTKPFRIAELLPTMDALVAEVRRHPGRLKRHGTV